LYVFFVIVFVILGNEKGNLALTEAQKTLASAPTGIMQSIQGLQQPLEGLVVGMASAVAASSMQRINGTITDAVDVKALANDTECVRLGFSNLPDPLASQRFTDSAYWISPVVHRSTALYITSLSLQTSTGRWLS
jgi:hypothetical protein